MAWIACSASSRVLPAMNRPATPRALGFAVTFPRRNSELAAFSNVAFSMLPTVPRRVPAATLVAPPGDGGQVRRPPGVWTAPPAPAPGRLPSRSGAPLPDGRAAGVPGAGRARAGRARAGPVGRPAG